MGGYISCPYVLLLVNKPDLWELYFPIDGVSFLYAISRLSFIPRIREALREGLCIMAWYDCSKSSHIVHGIFNFTSSYY